MYFHDLFCAEGKAKKFKKYRNYVRFLKNSLIRVSFLTCSVHNCHRLSPKGIKLLVKYVVVYYTVLQIYMHIESFVKKNPQFTKFQIFVFNKIGFKSWGELNFYVYQFTLEKDSVHIYLQYSVCMQMQLRVFKYV